MDIVERVVKFSGILLVDAYFVVLVLMILRGQISMRGILSDNSGHPSPSRLVMLIPTILIGGGYLIVIAKSSGGSFPDIPIEALLVLGGSTSYYLTAKSGIFGNVR